MKMSLVGWSESQDTAGVLTQVAALADQHITTDGDDIIVPAWASKILGVFAIGATISAAKITSPSLRASSELDVSPLNIGAEPLSGTNLNELFTTPRQLVPAEGLRAQVAEGAAGAEQETVLVILGDGEAETITGDVETIKCTSTATLVAYAWSLCSLTLSQQLRAGRYAIVGMRAQSAGAIAARLVIPGVTHRPGVIALDAESDTENWTARRGVLGNWGEFEHSYVPKVEFLSVSADTAETVYLDVIKVA